MLLILVFEPYQKDRKKNAEKSYMAKTNVEISERRFGEYIVRAGM